MSQKIIAISQIILISLISVGSNKLVDLLNLKIPGTILGIIVVFLLLQTKVIRLQWIERGANWLVSNLMLFLIPSAVGVIQYQNILSKNGLSLIAVIIISSVTVMVFTAIFSENISRDKGKETSTL